MLFVSSPNSSAQSVTQWVTDGIGATMVNNILLRTWVKLPDGYEDRIIHFINNCYAFKDEGIRNLSENYIVEQLENDWVDEEGNVINIEKSDRFLFIVSELSAVLVDEYIYDWLDGNEKRLENYEIAMQQLEVHTQDYADILTAYLENKSAEYDRRIKEAERQSAEARKQSAEARENRIKTTYSWLYDMVEVYRIYKRSPDIITDDEIQLARGHAVWIIRNCKEFGIDFKAYFLKELWGNEKTVNDLLKWYEVE